MPDSSSSPPSRVDASPASNRAVKTFEFEVGAGRSSQAITTKRAASTLSHQGALELSPQAGSRQEESPSPLVVRPVPRAVRRSSWWMTSLGLHLLLLAGLAFSSFAVLREEPFELQATPMISESVEEIEDVEINPEEIDPQELDSFAEIFDEAFGEEPSELADLESESLLQEPAFNDPLPLAPGESDLAGAERGITDLTPIFVGKGSSTGTGAKTKFFGTETQARRILYMLDNSGGMRKGGKFETLVSELQASVRTLQPHQEFYVIFYSDTVYPLFYPYSVRRFMPGTKTNGKQLDAWLATIEFCMGNAIDEALAAAQVIQPDVVFLLTDGKLFTTVEKRALLLDPTGRHYPIHTFGLGVSQEGKTSEELRQVAEANGGTFRAIQVPKKMKTLAQEKPRPYHSKEPGKVWGKSIGTWR